MMRSYLRLGLAAGALAVSAACAHTGEKMDQAESVQARTISAVASANPPNRTTDRQPNVINGIALDCFVPGHVQPVRALGVRAFDPVSHGKMLGVLKSLDTLVKSFALDDTIGVNSWNSAYKELKNLWTQSEALAHDSTSSTGNFSLTVPSMDSVLVVAFAEREDEPSYYRYQVISGRPSTPLLLDMSKGECGPMSNIPGQPAG